MLDHVILRVKDLARSRRFYAEALAPLGYRVHMEFPGGVGFAVEDRLDFWLRQDPQAGPGLHVAFTSADRPTVDAFHAAGLKAGGTDNGGPGIRTHYHPNYYGAFVFDPDGNNIEAVCHRPAA